MNLVFLVDSSGSVNDTDFGKFQMFIKDLAEEFKDAISEGDTEVAAVLFSTIPKTKIEFDLDDYDHINDIKAAVDAFSHQHGGQTRTGEALTFTLEEVFKKAPRPSVKNVLVVLTDGKAQGNVTGPAQDVRDHGVEVFAIGVGPHSNEAQLKDIASDPDDKHVFHVTDYKLEDITGPILDGIC
ncbi:predicted protein [Nematostella vectensis]|uniref:VWFA domain-containing protein n=1 Tax=Nematostella vectensis TaxID=45351 RepID=A7S5V0_NEMVE|nr:predicted protein [Nematostella vectensis]|eukprot:XP_001633032.1 predicted protein [Nematostella vectensis]